MDPFCVVSFSRKIFHTRVLRHTVDPVWDEQLLLHVRSTEVGYTIAFNIHDWDTFSANDYIANASLAVASLLDGAPKRDPETGLYPPQGPSDTTLKDIKLPLQVSGNLGLMWRLKHNPTLTIR
jgi:phosphatidylserine decarboxylase